MEKRTLSIRVSEGTARAIKVAAAQDGKTLTEWIMLAVTPKLEAARHEPRAA